MADVKMAAGTTWDTVFGGDVGNVFKGQFGFCLARDYDATKPLTTWTPFASDGNWSPTLLTTDGFTGLGYFDENGLEFTPTLTTADVKAWQTRQKLLTDFTEDSEAAMFTAIERTPYIEALESNIPFASMLPMGGIGYQYTKPVVTFPVHRQLVFGSIYMTPQGISAWARIYSDAIMAKPDKLNMNAKTEAQGKLTFDAMLDSVSGFAVRTLRDGPGWRARGGTTATPGTPTATAGAAGIATLAFTAPASKNGPFTYSVFVDATVTPVATGSVAVGGTAASPVLTVSGLTSGAHTFKVQAIGSNGSASNQSAASNSVTTS
ncbi:hypothetical protein [Nocardia terpenica]|uniref:Fibronectin type-III domain-containing protein n=1 Tax=Nocardia terpenica TaxID=455432 RepID=A0A164JVD2_9NOCA|nr:hypothetical protein [Nocardia terpenica]KZM70757.1 hypothetical protein AWN90_40060 [Nocardia terpenica]NQE89978.1 hypothetical protein [Nocardia terpenica]